MNKLTSIIRLAVILALFSVAMLLLVCEEGAAPQAWALRFIIDKALAIGAMLIVARLYSRWSKTDPLFIAYNRMCDADTD